MDLELRQSIPGRILKNLVGPPLQERRLNSGQDYEQIRGTVQERFEKPRQPGGLFRVQVVDLIEAEDEGALPAQGHTTEGHKR